ncbi:RBR-type E3 ubiquitin transferase [Quillaja saponaria]|uniref:RBR-type E3 ubiquitin transferase n=1 Tax=Quillaja saponaria TaxID=32244 RepID=A0AAD7QGA5_QUISA|nr:RBR-type E3 ubiquitin transferase [Quillaja saponaria]
MAAEALESDFEFAFRLQLQEALAASVALQSSSSSILEPQFPITKTEEAPNLARLQSEELSKLEQEIKDREQSEIERRKLKEDLSRRIHDQKVANEIHGIPEWGDNFEKPFGEGCSSSKPRVVENDDDALFRLYFKGFVSEERVSGEKVTLAGIGIAICDTGDNLVFEVRKPLVGNGMNKNATEAKALIEGLNAAIALDLKRITFYTDYYPIFQFVSRRWSPKQRKIAMLINQVTLLQRKFTYCNAKLVSRSDVKFAFKLARDAIISHITRPTDSSCRKNLTETCVICLEDTDVSQMFSVDGCQHRYCFSCMKQHVEVKLLHGMIPKCPHEGCNSELHVEGCRKFLTNKSIETMEQRLKEASIPISERIYCPYPRCSALMSKSEILEYAKNILGHMEQSGAKKCLKCHGLFCFNCKVPWHSGISCSVYRSLNPNPPAEDVKLKSLATRSLWRQCVKCNHMIELAEGCFHMTCRCGNEFCYNCGAEWKDKKATCSCPLWEENNIWIEDHDEDSEEEEEEYYDSDYSDSYF